jgi:hypothetical protein
LQRPQVLEAFVSLLARAVFFVLARSGLSLAGGIEAGRINASHQRSAIGQSDCMLS